MVGLLQAVGPGFAWTCFADLWAAGVSIHQLQPEMAYFHYSVTSVNALWRIFIWPQLNGTVGPSMQPQKQMSGLVVVFLQSARSASGWMPAGQTGRQCVATHSIVGSEECLQRCFLNQTEDQMPRSKAQWSTSGEWIVSWAHSDHFLKTHEVFVFVLFCSADWKKPNHEV